MLQEAGVGGGAGATEGSYAREGGLGQERGIILGVKRGTKYANP